MFTNKQAITHFVITNDQGNTAFFHDHERKKLKKPKLRFVTTNKKANVSQTPHFVITKKKQANTALWNLKKNKQKLLFFITNKQANL